MKSLPLTIYYDGLCPICAKEIAHYRKSAPADSITYVDFADPSFEPAAHGVDARRIRRVLHVKVGANVLTAVDALIAVWQAIPSYRWLARLAQITPVYYLMVVGYHVFAYLRPWLSRRHADACTLEACKRA